VEEAEACLTLAAALARALRAHPLALLAASLLRGEAQVAPPAAEKEKIKEKINKYVNEEVSFDFSLKILKIFCSRGVDRFRFFIF
jgi:hypothetical protein